MYFGELQVGAPYALRPPGSGLAPGSWPGSASIDPSMKKKKLSLRIDDFVLLGMIILGHIDHSKL